MLCKLGVIALLGVSLPPLPVWLIMVPTQVHFSIYATASRAQASQVTNFLVGADPSGYVSLLKSITV